MVHRPVHFQFSGPQAKTGEIFFENVDNLQVFAAFASFVWWFHELWAQHNDY